jgi:hypothetical protein
MVGEARPAPAYYVALGLLVVGLIAGLSLVLLLTTRPHSSSASVAVTTPLGTSCPTGNHATACYQVTVTNTGDGPAYATCQLTSAQGTQATFDTGASLRAVNLLEGATRELTIQVVADGGDTLAVPHVDCAASST